MVTAISSKSKIDTFYEEGTTKWSRFIERYNTEMSKPDNKRLIKLLALLSKKTNISIGCYCEDETHCHRKSLKQLIEKEG